jgi:hypothetical protein
MVPSPRGVDVQRDGRSDSPGADVHSLQLLAESVALAHRERLVQPDLCEAILRLFEGSRHCRWLLISADFSPSPSL